MDSSTKVDFANGQTHKKASKKQGDLRLLQLLSSELLHDQNENQDRQPKLLGISPKTLTPMELTQGKFLTSHMQVWAGDNNI